MVRRAVPVAERIELVMRERVMGKGLVVGALGHGLLKCGGN